MMCYTADDRDSFENLFPIHNEFLSLNQQSAYTLLVSTISPEIVHKQIPKIIKKAEVRTVLSVKEIPSYCEVRLDNAKHFDQLDRHLR